VKPIWFTAYFVYSVEDWKVIMPKSKRNTPLPEFPWSMHKSGGWKTQYDRVKRWHKRLQVIRTSRTASTDRDEALDFLYAFFQNCAHLRDWILYSKAIPQQLIEEFFSKNAEMKLCQDICNGTKHFRLDDPKRSREFSMAREYVPSSWPGKRPHENEVWVILLEGEKDDVFDLADHCMSLWEEFIKENSKAGLAGNGD
jgi:hypothetical protein